MAAASDFFKQLSAGVRFDRKRPESRIARPKAADQSDPSSQAQVIDFFNESVRPPLPEARGVGQNTVLQPRSTACDEESADNSAIGDISVFRKAMRINVKGEDVVDPVGRFADLQVFLARVYEPQCADSIFLQLNAAVQRWMLSNIEDMRWKEPTPVQMQVVSLSCKAMMYMCLSFRVFRPAVRLRPSLPL
jgi:hypothetical protein